jgi:diguanylate cyclase (GGDEF)-like protein
VHEPRGGALTQWEVVLGNFALVEFVLIAVVATWQWYRHRVRGAGWAALAFAILGLMSLVTKVVPLHIILIPWFLKGLLAATFVMPYCIFRFATSFSTPPRWVRATSVAVTLGVVVWTLALPSVPMAGVPQPAEFLAYRVAVACQWGFLFTFVVVRLWAAGRGEATMAVHRMHLLALAAAGLGLQVIAGAVGLTSHPPVKLGADAINAAVGVLFLLALVLPSFMRSWWHKHDDDEFRRAIGYLVTVGSSEDVASGLLPHVCALVGASSAALVDGAGTVVAEYAKRPSFSNARSGAHSRANDTISVKPRFGPGHHLVVKVSPYLPYFGRDELRKLEEVADLVGLAMDRCVLAELEREAKSALAGQEQEAKAALAEHEREAKATLTHLALHDPLTGLPNRDLLLDRLSQALAAVDRTPSLAVMFIDLDRFKLVNDRIDHAAGDNVLVQVAERLAGVARAGDTIARVGGDEFVALLQVHDDKAAVLVADRMREAIGAPMYVGERELSVTASIGVVVTREHDAAPSTLLREADAAMYLAKEGGRDHVQLFSEDNRAGALELADFERELAHAISEEQLRLHFQPIFRISDGHCVGVEALVRWQHPVRGLLPPDTFIPLAEESGLIVPLGAWVLVEACRQAARWVVAIPDLDPFTVWVNKSARQFHRTDVMSSVMATLAATGLDPSMLGVEITETVFMFDTERLRTTMSDLKAQGVSIAIDDFGTGFSSLGYLKRFPVDILKIDRSFIQGIGSEPETSLVTACLAMAKSLGIGTVAEGVESLEQGAWLDTAGCDHVQGFAYSRPLEADAVTELLRAERRGPTRPALGRKGEMRGQIVDMAARV